MTSAIRRTQQGFTIIEVMLVVVIIGLLAAISLPAYSNYARRAALSEVVLAANNCINIISEKYANMSNAPVAGDWDCESSGVTSKYTGRVQTSADGVIRLEVINLDSATNGMHVYFQPTLADGVTPMTAAQHIGQSPSVWVCGSESAVVRNSLPANCRVDMFSLALAIYAP